ncbi:MAG: 50S ribosomal protein L13 [Candidatus Omnitrophica bacterium]|nr:50S ribosomal protein L13 [Candidatus Omnitrophota bacterium]
MKIKRNRTYLPKKQEIKRRWYIVDAENMVLGRIAAKIATVLRGKNKPQFTPHLDTGDGVIVINAQKVRVTGKKGQDKIYQRYSGYPSGLKEINLNELMSKKPQLVITNAVKNMLPDNKLKRVVLKRLKIYKDEVHPHSGQNPVKLEI